MSLAAPPAPFDTEPFQRLPLTVDSSRLLREVGALFGSIHSAASELLQNSYRAGATRLDVTTDLATRTLQFVDNGPGLERPEVLFSLASSGWDPTEVIAAAGMGAFAIFALSDRVVVDSYPAIGTPWRAELTTEAFAGGDVLISHLPADPSRTGLSVTATLATSTTFPNLADAPTWRHRYPLAVSVDGALLPLVPLTSGLARLSGDPIPTSVGPVQFADERLRAMPTGALVWEHRLIRDSTYIMRRVRKAAAAAAGRQTGNAAAAALVAALLSTETLVWHVDPSSGVRPKLPDREVLIEDAALERAITVIAEAVVATLDFAEIAATTRAWALAQGTPIITEEMAKLLPPEVTGFGLLSGISSSLPAGTVYPLGGLSETVISRAPQFDVDDDMRWDAADEGGWYASVPSDTKPAWLTTPQFRCVSPYLVGIANALGLPTVEGDVDDPADGLPWLELDFDRMVLIPKTKDSFVENARFVSGGATVAPLTETVSRYFADGNCNAANTEAYALTGTARNLVEGGPDVEIVAIHPAFGEAGLAYLERSNSYICAALLALDSDGELYDYVDMDAQEVDDARITREAGIAYAEVALPDRALDLSRADAAGDLAVVLSSRFNHDGGSHDLLRLITQLERFGGTTPSLTALKRHLRAIRKLWPTLSEQALAVVPTPAEPTQ